MRWDQIREGLVVGVDVWFSLFLGGAQELDQGTVVAVRRVVVVGEISGSDGCSGK